VPDTGKLKVVDLSAFYRGKIALRNINLNITSNQGDRDHWSLGMRQSTLVRCLNRMHEVQSGNHAEGQVWLDGEDIYAVGIDPVQIRRRIGMVFQKATPFPTMSIEDNVTAGLRLNHRRMSRAERDRDRGAQPAPGRLVGGGARQTARTRHQSFRRTAAAPVYRARPGGGARGAADGRALLGARFRSPPRASRN